MAAAWWTAPSPPTACSSRRRPGSCRRRHERGAARAPVASAPVAQLPGDNVARPQQRGLEHASCLDEERKAIEFEVLFQTAPEQRKPSILRHVGELLARLRTFVFEAAYVLQVMNHFMHKNRKLRRRTASPFFRQINRAGGVGIDRDDVRLGPMDIGAKPSVGRAISIQAAVTYGRNPGRRYQVDARMTLYHGKIELRGEPNLDRREECLAQLRLRLQLPARRLAASSVGRDRLGPRGAQSRRQSAGRRDRHGDQYASPKSRPCPHTRSPRVFDRRTEQPRPLNHTDGWPAQW